MNSFFEQTQELTQLWADLATKMFGAAMAAAPATPSPDAAREVRSAMFRAMAESTDQFMRSPMFLDSVRQSLGSSVAMRKQCNDMLTELHHSVEGVARRDLDAVILSLRQLESRTLDRLAELGEHLDRISRQLESLEDRLSSEPKRNGDGARGSPAAAAAATGQGSTSSTPKQPRRDHV